MTKFGELYIQEDLTMHFEEELDKAYGKGTWRLKCGSYANILRSNEFPLLLQLDVFDKELDEKVGRVEISNKHRIDKEIEAYRISIFPDKIRIVENRAKRSDVLSIKSTPKN